MTGNKTALVAGKIRPALAQTKSVVRDFIAMSWAGGHRRLLADRQRVASYGAAIACHPGGTLFAPVSRMTRRRIIEPGMVWALSRRTTRRHFILNPDEARQVEQAYWYCLGHAAELHGVAVHAACLMSTHSHEVVTDVRGELSLFLQTFHRLLALCTKAIRGWPGEVFDKRSAGAHELLTPEATIESLAYLIANPVEAMAVRYAKDWPGAQTLPRDIGTRVVKVRRPAHYFDPGQAYRAIPLRYLVDARAPRGSVWARAVAPHNIQTGCFVAATRAAMRTCVRTARVVGLKPTAPPICVSPCQLGQRSMQIQRGR